MKNLFEDENYAEFNGKKVKYSENENYYLIAKKDTENTEKIIGTIVYAHYCPSNREKNKWKVELKKPIARVCNKTQPIQCCKTREEAIKKIKEIDTIVLKLINYKYKN
jgi:hypothetical protein